MFKVSQVFKHPIIEARIIRGGSLVVVSSGKILLTSVSSLLVEDDNLAKQTKPQREVLIGHSLLEPVFHPNLEIIYSNSVQTPDLFKYYNIHSQKLIKLARFQSTDTGFQFMPTFGGSLLEISPSQRFISSDGKKLALVFRLKSSFNQADQQFPFSRSHNPVDDRTPKLYQKPDLPGINYFTRRLLSQVSLCGEKVLFLASDHGLFSVKPDHASEMKLGDFGDENWQRTAQTILSRYSSRNGSYEGCSYIENPIIAGSGLTDRDRRYVACCGLNGKWIRSYVSPEFCQMEYEVNVES
ncbi:hypothetical protein Ciccas_014340, partial [Cichlidogyrus casuarinus]